MNRRAARKSLGSRTARRAGTKRHTQKLNKVQGSKQRQQARELSPRPAARVRAMLAEEAK